MTYRENVLPQKRIEVLDAIDAEAVTPRRLMELLGVWNQKCPTYGHHVGPYQRDSGVSDRTEFEHELPH